MARASQLWEVDALAADRMVLDLGAVIGANLTHTTYGFRAVPAAKEQTLRGGWSFGQSSGKLEYDGTFRRSASALGFDLRAAISGIGQVNFFGFGDDTPKPARSRYHIQQTLVTIAPAARFGKSERAALTIGPEFRLSDTGKRTGTILFDQAPYGVGRFQVADVRVTLEAGTRVPPVPGVMAVALGQATGETPDLPPGRGIRMMASGFVAPAVLDVRKTYQGVDGYVTGHVGNTHVQLARASGASACSARIRGSTRPSSAAPTIAAFAAIGLPATRRCTATRS